MTVGCSGLEGNVVVVVVVVVESRKEILSHCLSLDLWLGRSVT